MNTVKGNLNLSLQKSNHSTNVWDHVGKNIISPASCQVCSMTIGTGIAFNVYLSALQEVERHAVH